MPQWTSSPILSGTQVVVRGRGWNPGRVLDRDLVSVRRVPRLWAGG